MSARILFSIVIVSLSTALFAQPRGDFVELVKKWSPTVVDVSASSTTAPQPRPNLPKGHPFRDFFDNKKGTPRRASSLGSGFIIDPKGVVVTNFHVIKGATKITINLADGRKFSAKIIGSDQYTDVAVLQIESKKRLILPAVKFGDPNKVEVGQWVFAIGTPFGLKGTVTAGIVSAINRDIQAGNYDDFIQTDAAINRGNSGGPLFNTKGEVIGINTIIVSPTGSSAGAGFAIPISTALPVIKQLRSAGTTSRGWLGVQVQSITEELANAMGLSSTKGALVAEVLPGSPSEKGGLQRGDIIIKFNGKEIVKMRDLPRIVASTKVGTAAAVEVIRNGRTRTFSVRLGHLEKALAKKKPSTKDAIELRPKYGMVLKSITKGNRQANNIPADVKGVLVKKIARSSPAAESGLVVGSVIVEINRRGVRQPKDVYRLLDKARKAGKKSILTLVWFKGQRSYIALSIK